MLRKRISVLVTSFAVLAGGLTFGTAPANAAVSGASISVTQWPVNSTTAVTVSWTQTNQVTSSMVRSPWPWVSNWATDATGFAATGGTTTRGTQTITCTQSSVAIVFTFSDAAVAAGPTQPTCKYANSNGADGFTGFWIENNITIYANSTVSVAIPSGQVAAPSSARRDTWIVGPYSSSWNSSQQAEIATVAIGPDGEVPQPPPTIRLDINGNGGVCTPSFVEGEQGTWGTAPTADKCTNGTRQLAFFSTSPTAALGATNVAPGGPVYFLVDNTLYAIWRSDPPSAPTNVVATPGLNSVRVSWAPPASDGGDPIRVYNVRYKATTDTNYRTFCNTNAATLQCTAAVPATNTQYTFIVSAANQVGRAEAAPSSPVSPYDFKDITASRDDVFFGLRGTKVDANGAAPGLAGQALNVQYKIGSAAEWTTVANGVKVNAEARFSWSKRFPASANKKVVTVRFTYGADAVSGTYALPRGGRAGDLSAPRNIKATGELNRVALTWDPPKFDGGAKIIGYTICAQYIGTRCRDVGPDGKADFRNLLPGASYSFTVAARTATKTGPKGKANKEVRFTEASVRVVAREPGLITTLAEGRGFPDRNTIRLEVAIIPTTNQSRDRWGWTEIDTLAGGSRFSKTVEAELGSRYDDKSVAVRLVTPLGSVYSKPSRPPR